MGTGAVSGHSQEFAPDSQFTGNSFRENQSNNQIPRNQTLSGGDSCTILPTTPKPTTASPPPTDRAKVKHGFQMKMSCEMCSVNFTLFKRKKCCQECQRYFCSNCLPKPPANSSVGRQCSKCRLLVSGRFSRDDLQNWKIKDMRCFLNVRNISTQDCREKHDLIELVLARFCTLHRSSVQDQAEHENLVRQMAEHVRDISFVGSAEDGNSSDNSPASTRHDSTANAQTGSPPPSYSSATANTTNSASTSEPNPSPPAPKPTGETGSNSRGPEEATENIFSERASGGTTLEINSEQLQELLMSMEMIQEAFAQHERRREETDTPKEPAIRRTQLEDITELSQIDDLTVRQLKELLVNNFVDYKGCCEKAELVDKTKHLWRDHQDNKLRAERIHREEESDYYRSSPKSKEAGAEPKSETEVQEEKTETAESTNSIPEEATNSTATTTPSTSTAATTTAATTTPLTSATETTTTTAATNTSTSTSGTTTATETSEQPKKRHDDSLCHICMDSLVDCILLECGHMVTCTQCGKRLADCPVCRQYIGRVVRVFRS